MGALFSEKIHETMGHGRFLSERTRRHHAWATAAVFSERVRLG